MTNAALKIFPNKGKVSKKDNTIPVYFRIIVNGKKAEGKIPNIKLKEHDLLLWNYRVGGIDDPKSTFNKPIDRMKTRFDELISQNLYETTPLTPSFIRDVLLDKTSDAPNDEVLKYIESYYKNRVVPSTQWSKSTKKIYNKSVNHFRNFLNFKKWTNIKFNEAKKIFGNEFFTYLTSHYPSIGKDIHGIDIMKNPITKESASGIIKKIKTIWKDAIADEKTQTNPFDGMRIKIQHKVKQKLNIIEIKRLYEADLKDRPVLEVSRDLFLFQCFSGMAYTDMMNLKPIQIVMISNEQKSFTYVRQKTKIEATVIVNKYLQALIDKFKNHKTVIVKGGVTPSISLKEYNYRLKLLVDRFSLSIPELSTHYGRHSYRQLLTEAKIKDADSINTFMGWSRKKFMDSIYSEVIEEQLIDANHLFELYLNKHLI